MTFIVRSLVLSMCLSFFSSASGMEENDRFRLPDADAVKAIAVSVDYDKSQFGSQSFRITEKANIKKTLDKISLINEINEETKWEVYGQLTIEVMGKPITVNFFTNRGQVIDVVKIGDKYFHIRKPAELIELLQQLSKK